MKCIGSVEELKSEWLALESGFMDVNPLGDFTPGDIFKENYLTFDLHKSHVDSIVLVSPTGKPMKRESDLMTFGLIPALSVYDGVHSKIKG